MIGQEEPLKLLLNQSDPAQTGRVFAYYRYFGRARAAQIGAINAHLAELAALDAALAEEEARLTALEEQRQGELAKLTRRANAAAARWSRSRPNRRIARRSSSASKDQQGGLEKLVRELRRALERVEKFPTDSKDAFAKLRGKLAWPAAGRSSPRSGRRAPAA